MRVSPAAVAVPFLLLLLTWLLLSGLNLNSSLFDRQLRALDDFAMIENALHRDVLTARAGLLRHYDSLVSEMGALHDALDRLRKAAAADPEEKAAIDRLAALVDRQEELVEQFKSKNALLQNSLAYFGLFSARLATSDRNEPLVAAASTLAAAMLHLTLNTSPATALAVEERLDEFATLRLPPGDAESVRALLAHGRMLHDLLPTTDAVLKSLFAVATDSEQEAIRSLVVARQLAARASARQYRLLLYVTSLLLLGVLVHLGLRLRARAMALQRRAEFEHAIARISTRFINSQHYDITAHVESALGELAACIGADRAYFVTAGNAMHVYQWCRNGAEFPSGWPQRALGLASNSDRGEDGTIHMQNINRSARGNGMDVLAAAGLHSWLCISSTGAKGAGEILGFDALQAGGLARWNEFGLVQWRSTPSPTLSEEKFSNRTRNGWKRACIRPGGWKPSVLSPAGSRTISTTSSGRSWVLRKWRMLTSRQGAGLPIVSVKFAAQASARAILLTRSLRSAGAERCDGSVFVSRN